jgi:hypothetical protein
MQTSSDDVGYIRALLQCAVQIATTYKYVNSTHLQWYASTRWTAAVQQTVQQGHGHTSSQRCSIHTAHHATADITQAIVLHAGAFAAAYVFQ